MEKTIEITPPEGYEINKEKSTFEKIVFKPIGEKLPECWEDLGDIKGYWTNIYSNITKAAAPLRAIYHNRNIWPSREEAEASLYLAMLLQLRNAYNGDWVSNWNNEYQHKYVVSMLENNIDIDDTFIRNRPLAFKSAELRDKFISHPEIRKYILKAAPLL